MRRSLLLTLAAVPGFLLCSMVSGSAERENRRASRGSLSSTRGSAVADARVQALIDRSIITARSDALGKFQLAVPKNRIAGLAIFAMAPNRVGMLGAPWQGGAAAVANLRIQLVVSEPLEVSVADEGGRPVAGANGGAHRPVRDAIFRDQCPGQSVAAIARSCAVPRDLRRPAGPWTELLRPRTGAPPCERSRLAGRWATFAEAQPAAESDDSRENEEGRPEAGFELRPEFLVKPGEPAMLDLTSMPGMYKRATNAEGIADFDLPAWIKTRVTFWPVNGRTVPMRIMWNPAQQPDGIVDAVIPRPVEISGRVEFADGTPAPGIAINVSGAGYDIKWFQGRTTSRADGRFAIDVYPDEMYMLGVDDKKWGARAIDGIVVKRGTPIRDLKFTLQPATRVHGRVLEGKDRKPVADQFLALLQNGRDLGSLKGVKLPNPDDLGFYVRPSLSLAVATDREGRYEFHVGPGQYTLIGPSQVKSKDVRVSNQTEVTFDFDAPRPEWGRILGQVVDAHRQPVPRHRSSAFIAAVLARTCSWLRTTTGSSSPSGNCSESSSTREVRMENWQASSNSGRTIVARSSESSRRETPWAKSSITELARRSRKFPLPIAYVSSTTVGGGVRASAVKPRPTRKATSRSSRWLPGSNTTSTCRQGNTRSSAWVQSRSIPRKQNRWGSSSSRGPS